MDFTVEFVLRNLVIWKIFVEFRDSRIFFYFWGIECLMDLKNGIFKKKNISKTKNELVKFMLKYFEIKPGRNKSFWDINGLERVVTRGTTWAKQLKPKNMLKIGK